MAPSFKINKVTQSLVRVPGSGNNPKRHDLKLNLARQIRNREGFPTDVANDILRYSSAPVLSGSRGQSVTHRSVTTQAGRPSCVAPQEASGGTTAQNDSGRSGCQGDETTLSGREDSKKKRTQDSASSGDAGSPHDAKSPRVTALPSSRNKLVVCIQTGILPSSTLREFVGHSTCSEDRSNTVTVAPAVMREAPAAGTPSTEHGQTVVVVVDPSRGLRQPSPEGNTTPAGHNLEVPQAISNPGGGDIEATHDSPASSGLIHEDSNPLVVDPSSQSPTSEIQNMRSLLFELEEKIRQDELEKEKLRKDKEILTKKVATFREIFQDTGKLNAVLNRLNIKVY